MLKDSEQGSLQLSLPKVKIFTYHSHYFDALHGYLTFEVIQELSRDVMDGLLLFRDDVLIKERGERNMSVKYLLKNAGKRNVTIFVLVQIMSSCVVAGVALLLSVLLNTVFEVIISGDIARLLKFIGLCCIYAIATGIRRMLQGYVRARLVRDTVIKMRNSAVKAYLRRKDAVNMNKNSAEFLSLLSQNMDTIEKDWLGGLLDAFASCCEITIASLLLLYINPIVAVISRSCPEKWCK